MHLVLTYRPNASLCEHVEIHQIRTYLYENYVFFVFLRIVVYLRSFRCLCEQF